jgi:hypothetical protein
VADKKALQQLIEQNGGKLVRSKNHLVYKFPSGLIFTTAVTPSCSRSYDNTIADLKRLLGLHDPDRGKPGERHNKRKRKPGATGRQHWESAVPPQLSFRDKLLVARVKLAVEVAIEEEK